MSPVPEILRKSVCGKLPSEMPIKRSIPDVARSIRETRFYEEEKKREKKGEKKICIKFQYPRIGEI